MITLADIREWLKTLDVAEHYYIGRLDNKEDKSLGVYPRSRSGDPVIAIGAEGSYDVKAITLLLHWNKNANDTEIAAYALWDKLQNITQLTIGEEFIQYLMLRVPHPISVNYDSNGVYEYVIDLDVYYRR